MANAGERQRTKLASGIYTTDVGERLNRPGFHGESGRWIHATAAAERMLVVVLTTSDRNSGAGGRAKGGAASGTAFRRLKHPVVAGRAERESPALAAMSGAGRGSVRIPAR